MIYRVFNSSNEQLAEVHDASWPLIKEGERIPLVVEGREGLYMVTKVGDYGIDRREKNDRLVLDIWVK